jgi:hypothetical protein
MAEMSMNKAIHGGFRRDLTRFITALSSFPIGDPKPGNQLAAPGSTSTISCTDPRVWPPDAPSADSQASRRPAVTVQGLRPHSRPEGSEPVRRVAARRSRPGWRRIEVHGEVLGPGLGERVGANRTRTAAFPLHIDMISASGSWVIQRCSRGRWASSSMSLG